MFTSTQRTWHSSRSTTVNDVHNAESRPARAISRWCSRRRTQMWCRSSVATLQNQTAKFKSLTFLIIKNKSIFTIFHKPLGIMFRNWRHIGSKLRTAMTIIICLVLKHKFPITNSNTNYSYNCSATLRYWSPLINHKLTNLSLTSKCRHFTVCVMVELNTSSPLTSPLWAAYHECIVR